MGTNKTEWPKKLAEKLRRIRFKLGLSQTEMATALTRHGVKVHRDYISFYENEERLPPILVALCLCQTC